MPANETPALSAPLKPAGSRRNTTARSRGATAPKEAVRYFIGKSGDPKPHLDREVASEPEGLVVAFKTDERLFVVQEFTVEQRIERGRVTLTKVIAARTRVSTTNAS